jgi:hypothetical protein
MCEDTGCLYWYSVALCIDRLLCIKKEKQQNFYMTAISHCEDVTRDTIKSTGINQHLSS